MRLIFDKLKIRLVDLSASTKIVFLIIMDVNIIISCLSISYFLRFDNIDFLLSISFWSNSIFLIITNIIIFSYLRLYSHVTRFISFKSLQIIFLGIFFSSISLPIFSLNLNIYLPRSILFIYFILSFTLISFSRFFLKSFFEINPKKKPLPILIYGAGSAGIKLLNYLKYENEYEVKAFIDDSKSIKGRKVENIKIYSRNCS